MQRDEPESQHSVESQLRTTLDVIPAYTWYAVPSGALTFVNQRIANYLGLPNDHPLRFGIETGAAWDSHILLLHPDDHEETRRVWSTCLRTGCAGEVSFRVRNAGGRYRWFLSRAEPLRASDGTLLYWVGVNLDIDDAKQAEGALKLSESYLAEAQTLSHMGSWAWRLDGKDAVHLSDEWYRIYGFDPQKGMPSWEQRLERIHPEDRSKWRDAIEGAIREKSNYEVEFRILLPDKTLKWVHTVGHPVLSSTGELVQFVGSSMDITRRKGAEEKLKEQEFELRQMLDVAPQMVAVFGPERERLYANRVALDYLGMTLDEWRQRSIGSEVHPEDSIRLRAYAERALVVGDAYEMEVRVRRSDATYRWFLARYNPVRDEKGQVIRWYVACTDIEERRQAEEQLRHENIALKRAEEKIRSQENELRQMLDLAPQLVAVYGPNHERIYANRITLDYLGLSLDEWKHLSDRGQYFHPDDQERAAEHFSRARLSDAGSQMELRLRKQDGSYRWFLSRYIPLRDESGRILRWYGTAVDIEDRKQDEERLEQENVALREEITETSMYEEIVGTSPALKRVLSRISKVAPTNSTVLVTGETGTGKELVARAIHRRSSRASRPFVSVNCAAVPRELIASELFGHEKGAFTGATQRRLGRFELANGGTVFLDEVGELLPDTQVALLRVLQEREIERIGGMHPIQIDVRIVAATNRDLATAVATGGFRQDLFYRLNVFPIEMPSLRERKEDILILVEYFVQRYATRAGKQFPSIDKKTLELLSSYEWPGNIRELQNVIERCVILNSGGVFSVDESWLFKEGFARPGGIASAVPIKSEVKPRGEREIIEAALASSRGRVSGPSGAAVKLRIPPSTLDHRIKALNIDKGRFKFL